MYALAKASQKDAGSRPRSRQEQQQQQERQQREQQQRQQAAAARAAKPSPAPPGSLAAKLQAEKQRKAAVGGSCAGGLPRCAHAAGC